MEKQQNRFYSEFVKYNHKETTYVIISDGLRYERIPFNIDIAIVDEFGF